MTVPVSSPGVYIEEIPSSVHTVTGVSTSATAFVDFFSRGPVNQATQVDNWNDFQRIFGGIDTRSEASYGVYQYFLNGGQIAWIIRLVDPTSAKSAAAAASISVTSPGGGAQTAGGTVNVAYSVPTPPAGATVTALLSTDGGRTFASATPSGKGTNPFAASAASPFSLTLPKLTAPASGVVRLVLNDSTKNLLASGDSAPFSILPAGTPTLTLTAPTGTVTLPSGLPIAVTWNKPATAPETYAILISTDAGATFAPIATSPAMIPGDAVTAQIPSLPTPPAGAPVTAQFQVVGRDALGNPIAAGSSGNVTLQAMPPIAVSAPVANAVIDLTTTDPVTVTWAAPNGVTPASYSLQLSTDGGKTFSPIVSVPPAPIPAATLSATVAISALPTPNGTSAATLQVVALDANNQTLTVGNQAIWLKPKGGPDPPAPSAPAPAPAPAANPGPPAGSFQLAAANPGVWGNSVVVTLSPGNGAGTFNLTAQAVQNGRILQTESFSNLTSSNPNSGSFVSRVLSTAQLVTAIAPPPASGATGVWLTPPTRSIGLAFSGGDDGNPNLSGGDLISSAYATGNPLASLDDIAPSVFNILCMPAIATLDPKSQIAGIFANAIQFCEGHKAMFLVDIPPATNNVAAMNQFATDAALLSQDNIHGAVYYPRLVMPDPVNGYRPRNVGASGTLAGVYARTDTQLGVWVAPAGTTAVLQGASPAVQTTDSENGQLNPLGINCLRTFPIFGNISWGARTLAGADQIDSEWKYIPVRRLTDYIELSLDQSLKWAVFQPNAAPLWANLSSEIGTFLAGLWVQGALQGQTQDQAFFVRADSTTTTQTDILQGIVNVLIGIAPVKPAEFVILQFQLLAGQSAS